jgi:alkanesulfonate monooxygenase SsuD/methylene tetrahydromethanopterin reductase-like flavin-dependent oxidoreductase (luciferase family)
MDYALQVSGTYDHVLDAARFAVDRGLVALALPDHYLMAVTEEAAKAAPAPDAFIQFGGLARETESIELVMLVSPITFRHPAVLAKMAVTLDHMSEGRFALGVGTGWFELEHDVFGLPFPDTATRFQLLEEALGYLTASFDPSHPGFEGQHFRLRPFPLSPPPLGRIPIVVGGLGKRVTPDLAGRFADEFNVYPGDDVAHRIARFRAAATEAGRDPDGIRLSSSGQVVAAATQAGYEALMDQRASDGGMTRGELEAYFDHRRTPRGTFDQVREELERLSGLGISRFYFQGIYAPSDMAELLDGLEVP